MRQALSQDRVAGTSPREVERSAGCEREDADLHAPGLSGERVVPGFGVLVRWSLA